MAGASKAYLQARGEPAGVSHSRAVTLALALAQLDATRERLGHERGDD